MGKTNRGSLGVGVESPFHGGVSVDFVGSSNNKTGSRQPGASSGGSGESGRKVAGVGDLLEEVGLERHFSGRGALGVQNDIGSLLGAADLSFDGRVLGFANLVDELGADERAVVGKHGGSLDIVCFLVAGGGEVVDLKVGGNGGGFVLGTSVESLVISSDHNFQTLDVLGGQVDIDLGDTL
eukprot:403370_1